MTSSSCASGAVSQRAGVQHMSAAFLEDSGSRHRILTCAADAQAFERRRDEHVSVQVSRHGQCCRLSIFIVCIVLSFLGFFLVAVNRDISMARADLISIMVSFGALVICVNTRVQGLGYVAAVWRRHAVDAGHHQEQSNIYTLLCCM